MTHLQWANLEHSWASGHGVISDSGVATSEHSVGLARDRRSAFGRSGHGNGKTALNSSSPAKQISTQHPKS